MIRQIVPLIVLLFLSNSLSAQSKYSRIKIDLTHTEISELSALGLETDHGSYIPGVHFVNDFSANELALINAAGIKNTVLIDDLKADYLANKNGGALKINSCEDQYLYEYQTPENYSYGSMGGYHTYDEMLEVLADMHEKYPNLITGINNVEGIKTWEENNIIWLKISDNPEVDEDEPEVLYTALHHAREPNSLSQMIFYLWYLLENYETDDKVKYLVDNTEMYFMPCLNPDGYKYNEFTDPEGGGFWRKNRRPDLDPEKVGVDLNRNYGYFWGFDDFGSSPDMESNVYRGPQGFSEPETRAVRAFCLEHNFKIALNYHTHGNLLIHPWGYNDLPTEEDLLFKALGKSMTRENNFVIGTGTETVGYVVNGNSDDYLYGEEAEKDKIYSFTPEVGPKFWPQEPEIDQLNKSCIKQNLVTASLLLNYYDFTVSNLQPITSEYQSSFDLNIVKAGLKEGDATIAIISNNPDVLSFPDGFFIISLDITEELIIPVNFFISENTPSLQDLSFDVVINGGGLENRETYNFTYRNSVSEEVLIEDFADLNSWDAESSEWGLTQQIYVSAPNSLTDSPAGPYKANIVDAIILMDQVSLENADFTILKFSARWEIEYNYDYVLFQISNDNGENWTSLCGNYTRAGVSSHGTSDPLYDGFQFDWIVEEIDLSDYNGQFVNLRLMFVSDGGVELDGFYIDDIILENENLVMTGTEELLDVNLFSVYPSLNNGTFDVKVDPKIIGGGSQIEIYNIDGKLLTKREVRTEIESITLDGVNKGIFIVKLIDREGRSSSRKINIIR